MQKTDFEFLDIITLEDTIRSKFLEILIVELLKKFEVSSVEQLPENYSNKKEWSLLSLIENGDIDTYQILYVKKKFWGASGGIIRKSENSLKVYQAGFRTFSNTINSRNSLGTIPYVNAICLRHQIQRAKMFDCDKIVISFNQDNIRLFNIMARYHNKRAVFGVRELMKNFKPLPEPIIFNGVPQWILEMNLK